MESDFLRLPMICQMYFFANNTFVLNDSRIVGEAVIFGVSLEDRSWFHVRNKNLNQPVTAQATSDTQHSTVKF